MIRAVIASIGSRLGMPVRSPLPGLEEIHLERDGLRADLDLLKIRLIEVSAECGRYRSWYEMAKQREQLLIEQNASLAADNKRLKRDLYARKSEASAKKEHGEKPASKRKRGQQSGNPTPARRTYPNLPVIPETVDLPQDQQQCPECGLALEALPMDDTSTVVEIQVKGYVRRISKRCYRPGCTCGRLPGIVSQPVVGSLFPGSQFGVSVFTEFLMSKFCFGQPIFRLLEQWRGLGVDVAPGTIYGLQRPLLKLFAPIYRRIGERNRQAKHWHIDETRWQVLVQVADKTGTRWWMWVFVTEDTVYFVLSPKRSARVVTDHLGRQPEGIASVDRYSAYKAVALRSLLFLLAYCWAHARRDFTTIVATIPAGSDQALAWILRIGKLYQANDERVAHLAHRRSQAFRSADRIVRDQASQCQQQVTQELAGKDLHPAVRKAVERLHTHMEGLLLFVDHPQIPMDNNISENALRFQVVLRKNSFFNGSLMTAQFHVTMTSVIATLERNGINPRTWMMEYLQHCALAGGKPPENVDRFLPWNASTKDLQRWSVPEPAQPWPGQTRPDDGGG
jgi:transposase